MARRRFVHLGSTAEEQADNTGRGVSAAEGLSRGRVAIDDIYVLCDSFFRLIERGQCQVGRQGKV